MGQHIGDEEHDVEKFSSIGKLIILSVLEDLTRRIKKFEHQDVKDFPPLYRVDKIE